MQEVYCKSIGNNFLLNYSDLLGRDVLTMLLLWEKTASGHFYGDRWHTSKRTGLFYLSLHIQKKEDELYILYFLDSKTVFPGRCYLKFPHIRSECELGAYNDFLFYSKHYVHCCLEYPNEALCLTRTCPLFPRTMSINTCFFL